MGLLTSFAIGQGVSLGARLLGSLFGDTSDRDKALKALKKQIEGIQGYSSEDKADVLSGYDRSANSYTKQALNNAALSTAGKQGAKAAVIANVAPGLATQKAQANERIVSYNKELPFRKAALQAQLLPYEDTDTPQRDFMSQVGLGLDIGMGIEQINQLRALTEAGQTAGEMVNNTEPVETVPNIARPQAEMPIAKPTSVIPGGKATVEGVFPGDYFDNPLSRQNYAQPTPAGGYEMQPFNNELPDSLGYFNPAHRYKAERLTGNNIPKTELNLMRDYLDMIGGGK